ncbi:MAG: hypothetical protein AB1644_11450 [Candidatus Zixiibacteriota bacterium]
MNFDADTEYDLNHIIAKPLFFGMTVNIVVPMALLFVCYYLTTHGTVPDKLGETRTVALYLFGLLAVGEAVFAIWWRGRLFGTPMIRSRESFESDFASEYARRCRPLFVVIASISLYGYLFFFLSGEFNDAVYFVVFSFLVFQMVRPRHGMVRKLIDRQLGLVKQGRFLTS